MKPGQEVIVSRGLSFRPNMLLLGIFRFPNKMLTNMDTPEVAADVLVGSEDWADSPILKLAEPDLGI